LQPWRYSPSYSATHIQNQSDSNCHDDFIKGLEGRIATVEKNKE